jgi:hypothetical protein
MSLKIATLVLLCLPLLAHAQTKTSTNGTAATNAGLSTGAAFLFRNVITKASGVEQNKICKELELVLSGDRSTLLSGDYPVTASVFPTDLNKDGREELFVVLQSGALYGNTGEGYVAYFENGTGDFDRQKELGGGGRPVFLASSNLGYPDFIVGGPGFEFALYRWNGKTYKHSKMVADKALNWSKMQDLDSLTVRYVRSRK